MIFGEQLYQVNDYQILKQDTASLGYFVQCGATGGPRDIADPRALVARPAKLFVNSLLVVTRSFILLTLKDLKRCGSQDENCIT
jgi:hypothetical protein